MDEVLNRIGTTLFAVSFLFAGCHFSEVEPTTPSVVEDLHTTKNEVISKMDKTTVGQFLGAWELLSLETILENGDVIYGFGETPYGRISYSSSGHMSAHVVNSERVKIEAGQQALATSDEALNNFQNYIAYFGTYEIDEATQTITHNVSGALFKNWEGDRQERFYKFDANQLHLSTAEFEWGDLGKVRVVLKWQKL